MSQEQSPLQKPLLIIVHGVGEQDRFGTLRQFIEGSTSGFDIPIKWSLAQFEAHMRESGKLEESDLPFAFSEYNYARMIENHREIAEQDPRRWIRSFRNRLRGINRYRNGPEEQTFSLLDNVADDLLFASTLARLIADRLHLQTTKIDHAAVHFLQQVQLYIDHDKYRDEINKHFAAFMGTHSSLTPEGLPNTVLVAHSLGTVVTFRALLDGAANRDPWVKSVRGFFTFGSPVDLLLLLFPELFKSPVDGAGLEIPWNNYTFGNDPIATDLAIARQWVSVNAPTLFRDNDPDEVYLGPGTLVSAHTDYWEDADMLGDMRSSIVGLPESHCAATELRSKRDTAGRTVFHQAFLVTAAAVAWTILVWWEENLKDSDAHRLTLLGNPVAQISAWLATWLVVVSHIKCWSARSASRKWWFIVCGLVTLILITFLPSLKLLGGILDDRMGKPEFSPYGEPWRLGNLILLLIPLSALGGASSPMYSEPSSQRKVMTISLLALLTVFLSLLVGSRDNPSNATSEFALLFFAFATWWLSVLLSRLHEAYRSFVGGREHLDTLARFWNVTTKNRGLRHPISHMGVGAGVATSGAGLNGDSADTSQAANGDNSSAVGMPVEPPSGS